MASDNIEPAPDDPPDGNNPPQKLRIDLPSKRGLIWGNMLGRKAAKREDNNREGGSDDAGSGEQTEPSRWNLGILSDPQTDEVPGSVLLLSKASEYNEPLGLRNAPARSSATSLPSPYLSASQRRSFSRQRWFVVEKKRTADGEIVLEPQPDDSLNDPLNWGLWRRDAALLSLGFYCMVGGGMTPVLAAGFNEVAAQFNTNEASVALTTGLYMLGLGLGSVFLSPTAILFGKRPVYLVAAICFIISSMWCALSPNLASLIVARIFMGFSVSSVECLPSASVAEIFFLHEKAYRLGIYTLLLLGGKNLVPLVSAAIIQTLGWRWVFWVICMVVALGWVLLFLFVPETFWDRTPRPHRYLRRRSPSRTRSIIGTRSIGRSGSAGEAGEKSHDDANRPARSRMRSPRHAHFENSSDEHDEKNMIDGGDSPHNNDHPLTSASIVEAATPAGPPPLQTQAIDYFTHQDVSIPEPETPSPVTVRYPGTDIERSASLTEAFPANPYTSQLQQQPPRTFRQQLKPWTGRLTPDNWFRVALRPFILFAYPSILWSALIYALSIGWLIVISESVAHIYEDKETYNFTPLQAGLVYISPFVAGVLGTAVAGKVSDVVVRFLARRNGGVYEPEFRLVMAIPITITTVIGLIGYGWSADEHSPWIVPTVFFGFISFGCSLGSTTSITFAVDSYRQYAGEALVTLNFSKNILHGMVFSLFFNRWLAADGAKITFVAIGAIQLACLLTTIPMYIYGKRARMWTVRKDFMGKF